MSESPQLICADVREHWDRIKDGVSRALAGSGDRAEDVYAALVTNQASLYLGDECAFVLRRSELAGDITVRVWVMCSWGEPGAMRRHSDALDELARSVGASRLICETLFSGVARALPEGWCPGGTTYTKRLD